MPKRPRTGRSYPVEVPRAIYREGQRVKCLLCLGDWEFDSEARAAQYVHLHSGAHAGR